MLSRMIRAALLDRSLYEEARQNATLTTEALLVLALVSGIGGFGSALLAVIRGLGIGWFFRNLFLGAIAYLLAWLIFYGACYIVGIALGGRVGPTELLRPLAYAYAPAALWFLLLIDVPALQTILIILLSFWLLITSFIAIQQTFIVDAALYALIIALAGSIVLILFTVFAGGGMGVTGTWATSDWWVIDRCSGDWQWCAEWCSANPPRCVELLEGQLR